MIVGTTVLKMGAAEFFSPQFRRAGLSATFGVEVHGEIGATTLVISVEDRNEDETSWNVAGTLFTVTAPGTQEESIGPLKEIVRLKYAFTGGSDGDGFHFVIGAPSWRPY